MLSSPLKWGSGGHPDLTQVSPEFMTSHTRWGTQCPAWMRASVATSQPLPLVALDVLFGARDEKWASLWFRHAQSGSSGGHVPVRQNHSFLIVYDPCFFFFFFLPGEDSVRAWNPVVHFTFERSSGRTRKKARRAAKTQEKLGPLSPAIPLPQTPARALFLAWAHLPIYN